MPFPINVTLSIELKQTIIWNGMDSWMFYMEESRDIQSKCLAGMPFPGTMHKGDNLTLNVECQSIARPLRDNDNLIINVLFQLPQQAYAHEIFIVVPIPQKMG